MSEKIDYQLLKKHMPCTLDRLERIENVVGSGTPDISYCIDGVNGWIEMKSPRHEPKNDSSRLLTKHNHPLSQEQKNWFLTQRNAGGRAFILICTDKRWMLINGRWADEINDMTVNELWKIASWSMTKPISKEYWKSLRTILQGGRV